MSKTCGSSGAFASSYYPYSATHSLLINQSLLVICSDQLTPAAVTHRLVNNRPASVDDFVIAAGQISDLSMMTNVCFYAVYV